MRMYLSVLSLLLSVFTKISVSHPHSASSQQSLDTSHSGGPPNRPDVLSPFLTSGETEAQRGTVTCLGSHREFVTTGPGTPECRLSSQHSWGTSVGSVTPDSPQVLDVEGPGGYSVSGVGGGHPWSASGLPWT